MKRAIPLTILVFLLVACNGASTTTPVTTEMLEVSTPTATLSPTETPEPTHTPIPTPTPTPTPIPTFTLSGVVFFDYNGNGIRDEHEPPIAGAVVEAGGLTATTNSDGAYSLQGVSRGTQSVRVSADGFRYISLSLEAFQSSGQPVTVRIEGDIQRDWGLMQGFLTLPFSCSDWGMVSLVHGFDHNPAVGAVRDYRGYTAVNVEPLMPGGTGDQHNGWDWGIYEGAPVLAMAPGVATSWVSEEGALCVRIEHRRIEDIPGYFPVTLYGHLSEILITEGQAVSRGTVIGRAGKTGRTHWVHLHASFCNNSTSGSEPGFFCRDPYGVVFSEPATQTLFADGEPLVGDWLDPYFRQSLWSVYNDPQCLP